MTSWKRKKLLRIIDCLGDWEILPLVFQAERLLDGQNRYGKGKKNRDWEREMIEEATDFLNYYVWREYDIQDRKRHSKRKNKTN